MSNLQREIRHQRIRSHSRQEHRRRDVSGVECDQYEEAAHLARFGTGLRA